MSNIINRINNEFDFNYQKYIKNNTIAEATSINPIENSISENNPSNINSAIQTKVETMDFDTEKTDEDNIEVLDIEE